MIKIVSSDEESVNIFNAHFESVFTGEKFDKLHQRLVEIVFHLTSMLMRLIIYLYILITINLHLKK